MVSRQDRAAVGQVQLQVFADEAIGAGDEYLLDSLGFLKEQARHYSCYVASIHLTAIRFCLLVIAQQQHTASGVAQMSQKIVGNVTQM